MTINQQPDILSLSGNIKDFRISSSDGVSFVLRKGDVEILSQIYEPNKDGIINISVKDIIYSSLSFSLKNISEIYAQKDIVADFTAIIDDSSITFKVIRTGIDQFTDTAHNFLTHNFLTWQPSLKPVTYYTPEFLTYYAVTNGNVMGKLYFLDDTGVVAFDEEITIGSVKAGKAYTIPVQYAVMKGLTGNQLPLAYYDIWVQSSSGEKLTYIQRYHADDLKSEQESWILFENSLGGIDTFRAYGATNFTGEHTHNVAEVDDISFEYDIDTTRKYQKNTGHLNNRERRWLLDFFPSKAKYIYSASTLRRIIVSESNVSYTDKELPSNYQFTYSFAEATPFLNIPRSEVNGDLSIVIPSVGSFTVPPRIVEFPRTPLSGGVLFPVQDPYSSSWGATTAGSLLEFIASRLSTDYGNGGGVGHSHDNMELLQLISYVSDYLLVSGKKINAGYADKAGDIATDKYLRKDQEDGTKYLLKFGEFIDDLIAGKGAGIFPDGRAQLENLEVRNNLTVLSMIINEIQLMSSDYSFTDVGLVTAVEDLGGSSYRLTLEKRTEADITSLKVDHIIKQVVNDILLGGTTFYTSWMRVVAKNINNNTITVVLYQNTECPGGVNFPPAKNYAVARRGSADIPLDGSHNSDADHWYLSSREGAIRFLQNVFKPVLEDHNYALSIGRFPKIDAIKHLPIGEDDMGILAQTIVAQNFYQYDYNGTIVAKEVPRGEWDTAVAHGATPYRFITSSATSPNGTGYQILEQHTVYHLGCKWGCLTDKTKLEPKWNSPDWRLIEGNSKYNIRFSAKDDRFGFFGGIVDTVVTANLFYGDIDITQDILSTIGFDLEWTRDSGNLPDDNAWIPITDGDINKLVLKSANKDMGRDFLQRRTTKFTCTMYIPIGGEYKQITDTLNFNS